MKKVILFFIMVTVYEKASSQWLTQSAEGSGSFIFKGTNFSFDLLKTDFSFTLNNLTSPVKVSAKKDNHFLFYGGGLNAKSEEGLGNLFSEGSLVPFANINAYLGFQFANSFNELYKAEELRLSAQITRINNQQIQEFINKMNAEIDQEILSSLLTDSTVIKKIRKEWKEKLARSQPKAFYDFLKSYKPDNVFVGNIIPNLLAEIEAIIKENTESLTHIRSLLAENSEDNIKSKLWRFSIFAFGGMDASSFRRFVDLNANNLSASFTKEYFHGANIGIGLNYQINRWKFGATYSYRQTNNFDLLDYGEYKLTSVASAGAQTLTQEITLKAYSGTYGKVDLNELNGDVIYSLNLGSSSNAYALLNAYIRGNFFSRNAELLPNTYNIGIGSYFFTKKSKFLGGLYIEVPDVANSYEKTKPLADQNIRTSLRRLTFGIVGKFSLNSYFSQQ